ALSAVQAHQDVNMQGEIDDADVIAAFDGGGQICVQVFFYRAGRNYGNRAYFPRHDRNQTVADVLGSFIGQFYADKPVPRQILVSHDPDEADLLAEALSHKAERKVRLNRPQRGPKRDVVANAVRNAREALERRQAESSTQRKLLDGVAEAFGLPGAPERIEVYDNSHIQGANAVGAMVVAGPEGFQKNSYRKFNIRRDGAPGDDYAMMREVFSRRFSRALKEDPDRDQGQWPDLVLIDGGKGQLSAVRETLTELGIDDVPLVAIAKGPDRNAGREQFFLPDQQPFQMPERDPVLFYLQRLRDEVHRFAIGTHRAKRSAAIKKSPLDDVPGIGSRRKKALLLHFGSARSVSRASVADLLTVEGISEAVAQKIYDHFHQE
ncbi:MAG: excinuclease ABC subunit UvrC, partial [Pseudomonadota bacterium]|nr:excinuclease ABC subunit UvrC [Pseudomonadota bacterium]